MRSTWRMALVALAAMAVAFAGTGCKRETPEPATKKSPPPTTKKVKADVKVEPKEGTTKTQPKTTEVKATTQPTAKVEPKPEVKTTPAGDAEYDAYAKKQDVPCAFVPMVSTPPEVDGKMDEVYKQAKPVKFKFLAGGDDKPAAATTVYVVSTDKEMYLFIQNDTPDITTLMKEVKEHDGPVWQDDSNELFIDPSNKRQADTYMHIAVNALGTTADAKGPKEDPDYTWNPKMQLKTSIEKKAWTLEMAIPFKELGVSDISKMNKVWAVNFNRMAMLVEGNEDTAWSPTGSTDSHVPSKYGCVWFQAGKVDNTKK